jgi:hypothetical protein
MNERRFRRNAFLVIGTYCLFLVLGVALRFCDPKGGPIYGTFKDCIPLIIAIPAAWLGYCFQRRQAYLKDVRELWSRLVAAIQDAIQYTHLKAPDQDDYGKVLKTLSAATEELRAVFTNVGEAQGQAGLFPFESIKVIYAKVSELGFGEKFVPNVASVVRKDIVQLWKRMRRHFLMELERGLPAQVDSPFLE